MKTLVARNILLLAVGGAGAAAAGGCGSSIDDCSKTRTCGAVAGTGGTAGAAGSTSGSAGKGGSAGAPATAGKSGNGPAAGTAGGESHAGGAAGDAGDAGDDSPSGPSAEDSGAGGAAADIGGCIDGSGHALSGTSAAACGADGHACVACATGLECKAGSCVCTEASCADGCCSSDGQCLKETNAHCGQAGASCASCTDGQRCDAGTGACVCDATSCPKGCCDGDGRCVAYANESDTQCGGAGSACAACSAGQACDASGTCACTPDSCDGWCHGNACEPFETLATDQPTFPVTRGIALRDSDVYWTGSSSSDPNASKYRIQRRLEGGSVETLLSNQSESLGRLLLGAERLFVLSTPSENIRSVKLDGSDLRTDELNVGSFRYHAGRIYWPDFYLGGRSWQLDFKSQSEADTTDVTEQFAASFTAEVEIADFAFVGASLAFGANLAADGGGIGSYTIGLSDSTAGVPPSAGRLEQLECDAVGNYYWLARSSASSGLDLLMQNDSASSVTAVTSKLNVTDFTLFQLESGKTFIYYAYSDSTGQTSGIRLYDTSTGKTYDVVTGDKVGSLAANATHLYFFEATGHRLVRTVLPHVVLGLGK